MTTDKNQNPDALKLNLNLSDPPVERGDSPKTQSWAAGRMAIYAALDAALTDHIIEAIKSLNELKWQIEEDARRTISELSDQRETLRREVNDLRSEYEQLEHALQNSHHELDEVRAQRLGLEREAQGLLQDARQERERLLREISQLRLQLDNLNHLTPVPRPQEQLWEKFVGNVPKADEPVAADFAQPSSVPPTGNNASTVAFRSPFAQPDKLKEDEFAGATQALSAIPLPPEEPSSAQPPVLTSSEDDLMATMAAVPTSTEKTKFKLPIDVFEFEADFIDDVPTFRIDGGSPIIRMDKLAPATAVSSNSGQVAANTPAPDPAETPAEVEEEYPPLPQEVTNSISEATQRAREARIQATRQRVQQLLGRREVQAFKAEEKSTEILDFNESPTVVNSGSSVKQRSLEKAELQEIGAKLGISDVATPPPVNAVRFGPGFKPRSSTGPLSSNTASVSNLAPVAPVQSVEANPLLDSSESFTPTPTIGTDSEVTTPAPRIGEIGDDNAHQFAFRPDFGPPPPIPMPTVQQGESLGNFAAVPLPPPPFGANYERTGEGDVETRLTISNLQGLSLLMMEKVVRGLPGVHHVTVTDFRRGVLEMDVRHSPDVKLDEVLPAMPDLKLVLVERGLNSLEFLQER